MCKEYFNRVSFLRETENKVFVVMFLSFLKVRSICYKNKTVYRSMWSWEHL